MRRRRSLDSDYTQPGAAEAEAERGSVTRSMLACVSGPLIRGE